MSTGLAAREVEDATGRRVTVPDRVERVMAAGPTAAVVLYVLAPEKMIGWPSAPRPNEREFILPAVRDLPELGRLTGRGDTANVEVVLKARPDLIFDYGSVSPTFASLAARVQEQTGIPYLLIDGRLDRTPAEPAPARRRARRRRPRRGDRALRRGDRAHDRRPPRRTCRRRRAGASTWRASRTGSRPG